MGWWKERMWGVVVEGWEVRGGAAIMVAMQRRRMQ